PREPAFPQGRLILDGKVFVGQTPDLLMPPETFPSTVRNGRVHPRIFLSYLFPLISGQSGQVADVQEISALNQRKARQ
ncbi:MAG: hypothetical protein OXH63_28465, partial [Gemmatimonadetes bacterium]|nr:hypothetical protein [Gemmatimonadota bacterium]